MSQCSRSVRQIRRCRRRMQSERYSNRLGAALSAMVDGVSSFTTPVGRATKDNEGLFRVGLDVGDVLWIPEQAKKIQARLMVCAHMKEA